MIQQTNTLGEIIGQPFVVRVEECDKFSLGQSETAVTRRAGAGIFLPDETNGQIVEGFDDARSFVSRAIVNNNQLKVSIGLRSDRGQRALDVRRFVE